MDYVFQPVLATELFSRMSLGEWSQCFPWGMNHGMMGWGWGGGVFMMFFWTLVLAALALFIRWLLTAGRSVPYSTAMGPVESALDILKKRYARGEITKEQLDLMRRDIE